MNLKAGLVFLFLTCFSRAFALEAVVAHNVFYFPDSGKAYTEIYWQINPGTLHYLRNEARAIYGIARADISFTIEGKTVGEDHIYFKTEPVASADDIASQNIMDFHRYMVPSGLVNVHLRITDLSDTTNKYNYSDTFNVLPPTAGPYYSGVQLIDTIYRSSAETRYLKNDQQQIPICTNFYDEDRNFIHYYFELYNADKISKDDYPLVQKVFISRRLNEGVLTKFAISDTVRPGSLKPYYGTFPINSLASGNYYINTVLYNSSNVVLASGATLFQNFKKYNPKNDTDGRNAVAPIFSKMETIDLAKTFLAKYNTNQLKVILKMLLPTVNAADAQTITGFLKKEDDMYMRYFIYNHFLAINKDNPADAWKDYSEKVIEVNKLFGTSANGSRGFETERGAIYLRYGRPKDRVVVENEAGALPYEIWQYEEITTPNKRHMRNGLFLFYRPSDVAQDYKLLHSNVSGEMQNTRWRDFLYVNGSGGNNGNSRAEQYFTIQY
jgi:GWxTD domain-containing protein